MAVTASAVLKYRTEVTHTETSDLGDYVGNLEIEFSKSLTDNDISLVYADSASGTTPATLDLTAVAQTGYEDTISYDTVNVIHVVNTSVGGEVITIGGGTTPLMGNDTVTLHQDDCLALSRTYDVDGSHKLLKITPIIGSGQSLAAWKIIVLGN